MAEAKKLNVFQRMFKFFKETKSELKKVTWPTFKQIVNNSLVVIASIILVCIFLAIIDTIFSGVVTGIITGDFIGAFQNAFSF